MRPPRNRHIQAPRHPPGLEYHLNTHHGIYPARRVYIDPLFLLRVRIDPFTDPYRLIYPTGLYRPFILRVYIDPFTGPYRPIYPTG